MQLPKKPHSPQSYKKKPILKESQRVNKLVSDKSDRSDRSDEISREPRLSS